MLKKYDKMKNQLKIMLDETFCGGDINSYENTFEQVVEILHPFDEIFHKFLKALTEKFHEKPNYINERVLKVLELKLTNLYQNFPFYNADIGVIGKNNRTK